MMAPPIPLRRIAAVFTRYANLTFGGGSATIAVLHREIVATRKWIDETQFALCFALRRLTPGTNLLAFCAVSAGGRSASSARRKRSSPRETTLRVLG